MSHYRQVTKSELVKAVGKKVKIVGAKWFFGNPGRTYRGVLAKHPCATPFREWFKVDDKEIDIANDNYRYSKKPTYFVLSDKSLDLTKPTTPSVQKIVSLVRSSVKQVQSEAKSKFIAELKESLNRI